MKKIFGVFFAILLLAANADAQVPSAIKLKGPLTGTKGTLIKFTFTAEKFKLKCQPENSYWEVARPIDQSTYKELPETTVYFVPQEDGDYTFTLGTVNGTDISLENSTIKIGAGGKPIIIPPGPGPGPKPDVTPVPDQLKDDLVGAYRTSPDASNGQLLLSAYQDWVKNIKDGKYKIDTDPAKADLKLLVANTKIPTSALRPFRDMVGDKLNQAKVEDRLLIVEKAILVLTELTK